MTYFEELSAETKTWAAPLKGLLLGMKAEVERVSGEGGRRLAAERLAELTGSYNRLIADGLQAQTPPEAPEQLKKQARNLLLRLGRRNEEGARRFCRIRSYLSTARKQSGRHGRAREGVPRCVAKPLQTRQIAER